MSWAVSLFFSNGGNQAHVVRAATGATATFTGDAALAALAPALDLVDTVNILCLPAAPPEPTDHGQLCAAAQYCHDRRAMLILDPPVEWTGCPSSQTVHPEPAVLPRDPNAVVYYPNLTVTDTSGARVVVGPAGAVAGVWARTDQAQGVWKSPSGVAATWLASAAS